MQKTPFLKLVNFQIMNQFKRRLAEALKEVKVKVKDWRAMTKKTPKK